MAVEIGGGGMRIALIGGQIAGIEVASQMKPIASTSRPL